MDPKYFQWEIDRRWRLRNKGQSLKIKSLQARREKIRKRVDAICFSVGKAIGYGLLFLLSTLIVWAL